MTTPIFCTAATHMIANNIITRLRSSGFAAANISFLHPVIPDVHELDREMESPFFNSIIAGAGMDGSIDGSLGLFSGTDLPLFPGAAPDPILASLSNIIDKTVRGSIVGTLTGMGLPACEAERYEERFCDGNILICIHAANSGDAARARQIILSEHGTDISTGYEPAPPGAKASSSKHRTRVSSWDESDGVQDTF